MATKRGSVDSVISHWFHMFEDFQESPRTFYANVEAAIKGKAIPNIQISRVTWKEGGAFSARREYLRVLRKNHVYDICGAPFGNGFFISAWLGEPPAGCLALFSLIPFLGNLFVKPLTYYQIDTALMFQSLTHSAMMEVIDQMTESRGFQALSEGERKPIMRDFYNR